MKRGLVRLMKHPNYRDAHGTDDHYMPTCFIAGVVGEEEDKKDRGVLGAELWELVRNDPANSMEFSNSNSTPRGTKEKPSSRLENGQRQYKLRRNYGASVKTCLRQG